MSYDFYLEKQNLLIEFQGIQHYEPVEIFGGEKQFKIQQEHDKRKREYAINNNIKLLEIPYWDFDNVEEILNDLFSSPEKMQEMKVKARLMAKKNSTRDICTILFNS